jgi:putative ABC transport system permease protein
LNLILLEPTDLLLALGLVGITLALLVWQGLGLVGPVLLATGRAMLQLLVLGYALAVVFAWKTPWVVFAALALMLTLAAIVTRNRISQSLPLLLPMVWGAVGASTALTLGYVNLLVIRPSLWYDPQYLIPLAGLMIASAMNGAALAGERLLQSLRASRSEIETHLCLGATPKQAIAVYRQDAIRAGMISNLSSMMVIGLVQLPPWMSGQLFSGIPPQEAASYQMLILFMLLLSSLLAILLVVEGLVRQLFSPAASLKSF